jgi:hypothetical protein
MQQGEKILSESGVFNIRFDEALKIEEVFIQPAAMKRYALQYGDFTIVDGTFCVSMYDLTLIVFSNVDALFKTTITGIVLAPAERSGSVIRSARRFSLDQEDTVFMTDQASAFATAAAQLKKIHILCLHHFRTAMFSAHSGMAQDVRTLFQRKCNKLIFDAYQDAAVFDQDFQETKTEFAQYPPALKFLQSLWDNRQSVCATFTAKFFTAGHVASQRAESNNSRIKEGGALKKEMRSYNLNQLLEHLLAIIRQQQAKAKKDIKAYIRAGSNWSKAVDDIWKDENNSASDYDCKCIDEPNRIWKAFRHYGQGSVHNIRMSTNSSYPVCDCQSFTSRLIPCRAICAVYSRVGDQLFTASTLHPRWLISNHPEFAECKSELGLDNSVMAIEPAASERVARSNLQLELMQQIRVPNSQQMRYRSLDEKSKELLSTGSSDDDFTYRFVMNGLTSLINAAKALRNGDNVPSFGVSAPSVSRAKQTTANLSRCTRKPTTKKRKLGECRTCTEAGRTDALGHRSNSGKCPLFPKPA